MFIVAYIIFCIAIMLIAIRRNRHPVGWLFIAIIISPILAVVLLLALPIREEDTRPIDPRSGLRIDEPDQGEEMIRKMSQGPSVGDDPLLLTERALLPGERTTRPPRRAERSKAWALLPLSIIFAFGGVFVASLIENFQALVSGILSFVTAEEQDASTGDRSGTSVQHADRQLGDRAADDAGVPLPLLRPDKTPGNKTPGNKTPGKTSRTTMSEGTAAEKVAFCNTTNLIVKKFIAARWGADPSIYRSAGSCSVTGQGPYRSVDYAYSTPITRKNRDEPVWYSAIVAHDPAQNRYYLCKLQIHHGETYRPSQKSICSQIGD